jgi:hypothetical protein
MQGTSPGFFFSITYLVALQDSRGEKRKKDEGPGCACCSSENDNEKKTLPKQERRFRHDIHGMSLRPGGVIISHTIPRVMNDLT